MKPTSKGCPDYLIDQLRRSSPAMKVIADMMPARKLFIPGFRNVIGVNSAIAGRIKNKECGDLLISASEKGNMSITKYLLDTGVDKNVRDEDNWTPLHWAVWGNNYEIVELLLEAGIDKNINTNFGTALHIAARNGNNKIVKKLVEAGVDLNITVNDNSALDCAVENGYPNIVKYLLDKGAENTNFWRPVKTAKMMRRHLKSHHPDVNPIKFARSFDQWQHGLQCGVLYYGNGCYYIFGKREPLRLRLRRDKYSSNGIRPPSGRTRPPLKWRRRPH